MEVIGVYEMLVKISLVINLLAFTYILFRKLFILIERRRSKRVEGWKVFQCVEQKNRGEQCGAVKALACFNLICNTISLTMATYIVVTTEITAMPYFTYNVFINIAFTFQLSTIFMNLIINILMDRSERCPYHFLIRNLLCLVVFFVIIKSKEDTFIGLILMFMAGSNITDDVMKLFLQPVDELQKRYQVFRTVDLLFNFVFLLLVPAVMFVVPVSFTSEHFFDMSPTSVSGFFIALSFLLLYNAWILKSLTCEYVRDMSKIAMRKRSAHLTNVPTVLVWQDEQCIKRRQAGFVQVSKTRFIRKLGEIPKGKSTTTNVYSQSTETALSTVGRFESIDLS